MLPWKKEKTVDPIELEKQELAEMWSREELNSEERNLLIQRYLYLDEVYTRKHKKLDAKGAIDKKTLFNGGLTVGLALLTLNYERFDVLRSKVTNLWLRRHGGTN